MRTLLLAPGDGLGVEGAVRVWDVMVFEGDGVVVRAAVAWLGELEGNLYAGREEVLGLLGWGGRGGFGGDGGLDGVDGFMGRVRRAGKDGGMEDIGRGER